MYLSFVIVGYSTYKVFQHNASSREKTRETCQFVYCKTAVAIKIILINAKLLLPFINIHLLKHVLLFANSNLIQFFI